MVPYCTTMSAIAPWRTHYTNQEALLGIIEKNVIWASDARYLNDHAELEPPLKHAARLLRTEHDLLHYPDGTLRPASECHLAEKLAIDSYFVAKKLYIAAQHLETVPVYGCYVVSFCSNLDALSQWRAYGQPGDNFAISILNDELRYRLPEMQPQRGWEFAGCNYIAFDEKDADAASNDNRPPDGPPIEDAASLLKWREKVEIIVEEWLQRQEDGKWDWTPESLWHRLRRLAVTTKHRGFREEAEERLVSPIDPSGMEVKFRKGSRSIIPYVEFDLSQLDWSQVQVWVGPTPDPEAAVASLKVLARATGKGFQVKRTYTPYRG